MIYKANGGTGDDVIDLIKNGQPIKARTNTFTYGSQTFTGWNTADNGVGGTLYQATDTITVPAGENSVTLYAQWGKAIALAWAAQKAGQTYGQFRIQVTPEMLADILYEYRAMKQKQRDEEAARLARSKKKRN